jgi:hypothetical protein
MRVKLNNIIVKIAKTAEEKDHETAHFRDYRIESSGSIDENGKNENQIRHFWFLGTGQI